VDVLDVNCCKRDLTTLLSLSLLLSAVVMLVVEGSPEVACPLRISSFPIGFRVFVGLVPNSFSEFPTFAVSTPFRTFPSTRAEFSSRDFPFLVSVVELEETSTSFLISCAFAFSIETSENASTPRINCFLINVDPPMVSDLLWKGDKKELKWCRRKRGRSGVSIFHNQVSPRSGLFCSKSPFKGATIE